MKRLISPLLPAAMFLLGLALLAVYTTRPVTLIVDGQAQRVAGLNLTVGSALASAGVALADEDRLSAAVSAWIPASGVIALERARPVSIWTNGLPLTFTSTERIPANLLARLGVTLYPNDRLLANGREIDPTKILPRHDVIYLQYRPARGVTIRNSDRNTRFFSSTETLGQALWEGGWALRPGDRLDQSLDDPPGEDGEVAISQAREVTIQTGGQSIVVKSSAETVGEALTGAGVALQGLDFSQPAEGQPLPADGRVQVVRVSEELVFHQTNIPFESSTAPDPSVELDQRNVITPGQLGVRVSRERVRYEDGREVGRQVEAEWVASEPVDQVLGYGTQVVVKTAQTPDGTIEYYRAVPMYATSYSPCRLGRDGCNTVTASGATLQKGIVAVSLAWYRMFRGARVYVEGYGYATIADAGGGIPGVHWIDLGYSDDDYVSWHATVTVYFLTPAPDNPPAILP